jgi:hypothetical protein
MGLFKRRAKTPKTTAVSRALAGNPADVLTVPPPAAALIVGQFSERRRDGHVGMQGYAPVLAVSRNRQRCEGCKQPVRAGARHICIHNAQYHLDSLTAQERLQLMAELEAHPLPRQRKQAASNA